MIPNRFSVSRGTDEDFFSISISDLMVGLLTVFILTLVYYMLNFNQATRQLVENDVLRGKILIEISTELQKQGIEVTVDTRHGVLRLPEGVLFDPGKADIKPHGKTVLSELSRIMNNVLNRKQYKGVVETVFIEGHTDNIPINNYQFPSNWELSAKRAINTWESVRSSQPDLAALKNEKNEPVFSCSGYAETRPVVANDTEEHRSENRRIDFRFSMTPPSSEEAHIIKVIKEEMD